jgi:hypothetical protein
MRTPQSVDFVAMVINDEPPVYQRMQLESRGEALLLRIDHDTWQISVIGARRWFAAQEGPPEYVTEITGCYSESTICTHVCITVDCGLIPPTIFIEEVAQEGKALTRAFGITHDQQDVILDLLQTHLINTGLPLRCEIQKIVA